MRRDEKRREEKGREGKREERREQRTENREEKRCVKRDKKRSEDREPVTVVIFCGPNVFWIYKFRKNLSRKNTYEMFFFELINEFHL